jgi:SnoaL-like domain
MAQPSAEAIQSLIDKQAVTEVLLGYCRAIDRRDAELMRRVYWPDAIDDHAVFTGNVEEFIAYSFPFMEGVVSAHSITNIWIDLIGPDSAFSECYFSAFHDLPADGGARLERLVGGRYLDRHERRGDEWRIIARTLVIDWYNERPGNSQWDSGRYANLPNRGAAKPDDPLYRLHPRGSRL